MAEAVKISYKIFLEAEDVSQSRILSCASYMKNILAGCGNPYISRAVLDDESDMDDFVLRLFVDEEIEEAECGNEEMAESFIDDMAGLVTEIAQAHSFLEMDGSFFISYKGETLGYTYTSAGGDDGCDFQEMEMAE
ncbi:MAG: hypothetical protein J6K53_05820 [Roseburia sp.]|nr:hypothetical protein [Roseburia sp.]